MTSHETEAPLHADGPDPAGGDPATPLQSSDVIELQAFLEKEEWIQEKIKLLEGMPEIDVFAGADDLLSGERPAGLPSHEELDAWIQEHNQLDEETDQFDTGDMNRLKSTAKAATERSLSPEDTDLVELTLTTLLELDRLLHLLQERSDLLELLSLRLAWDDERLRARLERRAIIDDLRTFVVKSARWNPATYQDHSVASPQPETPSHSPQSSQTNLSQSQTRLPHSRSLRFRLTERLNGEVGQIAHRILALKQGDVAASGKTLDLLIEKKTVPDSFLDEQDRIENDTEAMDGLSKFALGLVMQWKRADELYSDFQKDQMDAQALLTEMETASSQPPSTRSDAKFTSRSAALVTKLSRVSDPVTSKSFPRPLHALYPDQARATEETTRTLSAELLAAKQLARVAAIKSQEYHKSVVIVKRADQLQTEMTTLSGRFSDAQERLLVGIKSDGDAGRPPDLSSAKCLEPPQHSLYMASLPVVVAEVDKAEVLAHKATVSARALFLELKHIPAESGFKDAFVECIGRLEAERLSILETRGTSVALASRFATLCPIWSGIQSALKSCIEYGNEITKGLDRDRWRRLDEEHAEPLTPDTPSAKPFVLPCSPRDMTRRLDQLASQASATAGIPLVTLSAQLEPNLRTHVNTAYEDLQKDISSLQELVRLWERVVQQASSMKEVSSEAEVLDSRISLLRTDIEALWADLLTGGSLAILREREMALSNRMSLLRQEVLTFKDGLASRIPFVSSSSHSTASDAAFRVSSPDKPQFVSLPQTPPGIADPWRPSTPFDPAGLDDAVRSHTNVCAANLIGALHDLDKRLECVAIASAALQLDDVLEQSEGGLKAIEHTLRLKVDGILAIVSLDGDKSMVHIESVLDQVDGQVTDLSAFSEGLQEQLATIIGPALKQYQSLAELPQADDSEVQDILLRIRKERITLMEARAAQLPEESANTLHRLHETRLSLSNIFTGLVAERLDEVLGQSETDLQIVERGLRLKEDTIPLLDSLQGERSIVYIQSLLDKVAAQVADLTVFSEGLRGQLTNLLSPALMEYRALAGLPHACGSGVQDVLKAGKERIDSMEARGDQLCGNSFVALHRLKLIRLSLSDALVGLLTNGLDEVLDNSEVNLQAIEDDLQIKHGAIPPTTSLEADWSIVHVQSLLDQVDGQVTDICLFSQGLQERLAVALAPALMRYESFTELSGPGDNAIQDVLKTRKERIDLLKARGDQLPAHTTHTLRRLQETRLLLMNALISLVAETLDNALEQSETGLQAIEEDLRSQEDSIPSIASLQGEHSIDRVQSLLDQVKGQVAELTAFSSGLQDHLAIVLTPLLTQYQSLTGLTHASDGGVQDVLNARKERIGVMEFKGDQLHGRSGQALGRLQESRLLLRSTLSRLVAERLDKPIAQSETALQAVEHVFRLLEGNAPSMSLLDGEQSVDGVQSLLDRVDAKVADLTVFSEGLQEQLSALFAPPLMEYQLLTQLPRASNREVRDVLKAGREHIGLLEARGDQLHGNAAQALHQLREARGALSGILTAVEDERAEAARLEAERLEQAEEAERVRKVVFETADQVLRQSEAKLQAIEDELRSKKDDIPSIESVEGDQSAVQLRCLLNKLDGQIADFAAYSESLQEEVATALALSLYQYQSLTELPQAGDSTVRTVVLNARKEHVDLIQAKGDRLHGSAADVLRRLQATRLSLSSKLASLEAEAALQEAERLAKADAEEMARKLALEKRLAEEEAKQAEERGRQEEAERMAKTEEEPLVRAEEQATLARGQARQVEEAGRAEEEAWKHAQEEARQAEERARENEDSSGRQQALTDAQRRSEIQQDDNELPQEVEIPQILVQSNFRSLPVRTEDEDVFGRYVPIVPDNLSDPYKGVHARIAELQTALADLNLPNMAYPSSVDLDSSPLPTAEDAASADSALHALYADVNELNVSGADSAGLVGLKLLQRDFRMSFQLLDQIHSLASFVTLVVQCDSALSELIEHVDAFPGVVPAQRASDGGTSLSRGSIKALLSRRITQTSTLVQSLKDHAVAFDNDARVTSEMERIEQIWEELREMADEQLDPSFVRPPSSAASVSSGGSRASLNQLLRPPSARGSVMSSDTLLSDSSSVFTSSSNTFPFVTSAKKTRSASGPIPRTPVHRLSSSSQLPTISSASRQRTLSSSTSTSASARRPRQSLDLPSPLARTAGEARSRKSSLTTFDPHATPSRPRHSSTSSFGRPPRQSFSTPVVIPRERPRKRTYVANPKNKLDIAVGDVINKLPVNVKVEALPGWKDQSGKYWIGDTDPKLCYCRILRSQTVMVRVGGGWMELSKFIKSHFADLFRLLPPGPLTPRGSGGREERWISSSTLNSATTPLGGSPQASGSRIPVLSGTSEPRTPILSSVANMSPMSATSSSPGSPLASLQFMRRADDTSPLPSTSSLATRGSLKARTPSRGAPPRTLIWRP